MGWVDPYQIPVGKIIKKFISDYGPPETEGEWARLRQFVESEYEGRRDSIALRAKAEALVHGSDVADDMDGVYIEKDEPLRLPYAIITQGNGKSKGKRAWTRVPQTEENEPDIFVLGTDVIKKRTKPKPKTRKKRGST